MESRLRVLDEPNVPLMFGLRTEHHRDYIKPKNLMDR